MTTEFWESGTNKRLDIGLGYSRGNPIYYWPPDAPNDVNFVTEWASYQICKIASCACAGIPGTFSRRRLQRKPLVSDPGIHHGTCVTHMPWCLPGSLTRGGGENVPGIPGACATRNFVYLVRGPCEKHGHYIIIGRTCYVVLSHSPIP